MTCPICRFDVAAALREPIPTRDWLRHPLRSIAMRWYRWRLDTPAKNRAALASHVLLSHGSFATLHALSPDAAADWNSQP